MKLVHLLFIVGDTATGQKPGLAIVIFLFSSQLIALR